ncbi:thiamine phosphate synthase [Actinocorallia sp. API 0066]|uniref:thiamine phosphate synthase n=1 Tax=Actinocorallia sp. API 0066 TaxID=2896846 RepID=UPI001E61CD60|nr:thiamine phosphate synthase [Actinocorallia sp. API 0066]MCD0450952.1 thiamine phosphate synthase [Actinocorallia sp. API 0066]
MAARERLATARLYLCVDTRARQGDLPAFLDAVLSGGVDIVQLREKGLEARQELAALEVVKEACARHGALLAVNDRADIAYAAGADILHLGQDDLPVPVARRLVGPDMIVGRSTHAIAEGEAADVEEGVDYFAVGPVWETATKPGRPAAGFAPVRAAAATATRPWFAIGGINADNLDEVLALGAGRVVVVRALTEAADPHKAAAELSARLRP